MPTSVDKLTLPLTVSDQHKETGQVLRERMEREGYLYFQGLIPEQPLLTVRESILRILQRRGWLRPGAALLDGIAGATAYIESRDPEYRAAYNEVQRLEEFHALAHRPEVVRVLEQVAGEPILVHPRNIARIIFPHNARYTTPAHQDYFYILGTEATYTAWIPLSDCPADLGGLAVVPGSHKKGVLKVKKADGAGGHEIAEISRDLGWLGNEMKLGDVLFLHSLTIHSGLDNASRRDALRLSVDYRYQGQSQPVVPASLKPHLGSLSWEELYQGWKSQTYQYYWKRLPLQIVQTERAHALPPVS